MLRHYKSLNFFKRYDIDYKTPFLNEDEDKNQENKDFPYFLEFVWGKMT